MNGPGMTPLSGTGAVNTQPPAAGLTADGYGGGGRDIFADVLMYNTVYVTGNGAMSQNPQKIVDIQNWMKAQQQAGNPTNPVPANLADGLDGLKSEAEFRRWYQSKRNTICLHKHQFVIGRTWC